MLADPQVGRAGDQLRPAAAVPAQPAGDLPDGIFYPDWDDELRQAFQRETELFFESIIREDRNVVDLLTADYTFVNERLARHYGIPNIYGSHFRRVPLGPVARLPPRDPRQGQLPVGDVDAELPHVAGQARRVGAREHPRHAAAGAAAERAGARGHRRRIEEGADAARADDAASRQPDLRRLPQDHGPDRLRARQLRRRRQVADEAGRRGRHADRRRRDAL